MDGTSRRSWCHCDPRRDRCPGRLVGTRPATVTASHRPRSISPSSWLRSAPRPPVAELIGAHLRASTSLAPLIAVTSERVGPRRPGRVDDRTDPRHRRARLPARRRITPIELAGQCRCPRTCGRRRPRGRAHDARRRSSCSTTSPPTRTSTHRASKRSSRPGCSVRRAPGGAAMGDGLDVVVAPRRHQRRRSAQRRHQARGGGFDAHVLPGARPSARRANSGRRALRHRSRRHRRDRFVLRCAAPVRSTAHRRTRATRARRHDRAVSRRRRPAGLAGCDRCATERRRRRAPGPDRRRARRRQRRRRAGVATRARRGSRSPRTSTASSSDARRR